MTRRDNLHIIDVRDEDIAGGRIRGALHMPDSRFGANSVLALLSRAAKCADGCTIVFHCMESARRGPRCARRTVAAAAVLRVAGHVLTKLDVRILEGGFDQWVRRFWQDPLLVEGYEDDYWVQTQPIPQPTAQSSIVQKPLLRRCCRALVCAGVCADGRHAAHRRSASGCGPHALHTTDRPAENAVERSWRSCLRGRRTEPHELEWRPLTCRCDRMSLRVTVGRCPSSRVSTGAVSF